MREHTVALSDEHFGVMLLQVASGFLAKRSGTREQRDGTAEIILAANVQIAKHGNNDRRDLDD